MLECMCTRPTSSWGHRTHKCPGLSDLRSSRTGNAHMHLLRHTWLPRDLLAWSMWYTCHRVALRNTWVLLDTRRIW